MSNGKISAKQQEILEYIKSQLLAKGYPPSVREICEAVHLRPWRRMVISEETLPSQEPSRSLTMNSILPDARW